MNEKRGERRDAPENGDGEVEESERASRRSYSTAARKGERSERGKSSSAIVGGGREAKRERVISGKVFGEWESFDKSSLRDDHEERSGELDRRGLDKDRPPFPLESHVLDYVEQREETSTRSCQLHLLRGFHSRSNNPRGKTFADLAL